MKKLRIILLMLTICLFFSSCKKKEFIGKWCSHLENDEIIFTLYENGDYTWYREQAILPFQKGKWKVKGDSLFISNYSLGINEMSISYYIVRINEHQLIIKTSGPDWSALIYEFERKD